MFSRAYRAAITIPPLAWVTGFLLLPYALLFLYSFWSVSPAQAIVHSWTLDNYRQLLRVNVYLETLFRSMWIAARVMIFSLLLGCARGQELQYSLSFPNAVHHEAEVEARFRGAPSTLELRMSRSGPGKCDRQ